MTAPELVRLCVGAILVGVLTWFVMTIAGYLFARLLEWVDDFEKRRPNPVLAFTGRWWGFKYNPGTDCLPYEREGECDDDGSGIFLRVLCAVIIISPMLVLAYHQPAIPMALGAISVALFTARFVKRLKKKFDPHTADKDAHK